MGRLRLAQQDEIEEEETPSRRRLANITDEQLRNKILRLFKNHIGLENGITRGKIFVKLFGDIESYSEAEAWFMWRQVYRCMNYLRKNSYCFIVVALDERSRWKYYVVTSKEDAKFYKKILKNNIKKLRWLNARCNQAVKEKFYRKFLNQ